MDENKSYISTDEFINFKKEIREEFEEYMKKNQALEDKLSKMIENILDIQANINIKINEIIKEIKNIPMNKNKKNVNYKTDESQISLPSVMIIKLIIIKVIIK